MPSRAVFLISTRLLLVACLLPIGARAAQTPGYELESLAPIYLFGGYHIAAGVRFGNIRLRTSCIDGGDYDYEPHNPDFERNLGTGCGLFAGYFFSSHWHAYLYVEKQSYIVTNRLNGASETFDVIDVGPGIGYQFFMGKNVYLQPALHLYWRRSQTKTIGGKSYTLRETDISPTVRIGYRF